MALHVLHVVESSAPRAGSLAVSLGGLPAALRPHDIESRVLDADDSAVAKDAVRRADLIHVHGWEYPAARRAAALARRAGRPYVVAPHGTLTPGPYNRQRWPTRLRAFFRQRPLIASAKALIALNRPEYDDLSRRRTDSAVALLPYGLNLAEYDGDGAGRTDGQWNPNGARWLVMLGPLHPVFGCVALLKAAAELGPDADDWNIALVGPDDGRWTRMLEPAVRRKGGADRVVFADAANVSDQRTWLARADVVAAPALHIRPGVSILQAAAAGRAALATDCVIPPELSDAVPACRPNRAALREAVRSAVRLSNAERREAGAKAREAAKPLDWPVLVARYVDLYRRLA